MKHKVQERIDAVRLGKSNTLDLGNLGLTELPDEVYTLVNLRELSVANITLFSRQSFIDHLKANPREDTEDLLESLEESEADLKSDLLIPRQLQFIDAKICQLTSLEVLDLQYNRLARLPDSIGKLSNLRRLKLRENQLTELPKSITLLTALELLDIRDNPIKSVPHLPHLAAYEVYNEHFHRQKVEAFRAKDVELAAWYYKKATGYGLQKDHREP